MTERSPTIVFTDAYLNDPIKFVQDPRFAPETALRELPSQSLALRDEFGYLQINLNTTEPQNYPVRMITTVLNRYDFKKVVNTTFTQLGVDR
jgi:hypothetical protein